MQVQKIQNNQCNPDFNGILKVRNYKKGGKVIERLTSDQFDKSLFESAKKNLFDGEFKNEGNKNIQSQKLSEYTNMLKRALGINIPEKTGENVSVKLKNLEEGYSVKIDNEYKITHVM